MTVASCCPGIAAPVATGGAEEGTDPEADVVRVEPVRDVGMGQLVPAAGPDDEPALLASGEGRVVLADRKGTMQLDWPDPAEFPHRAGVVSAVAWDRDGTLWLAGSAGLTRNRPPEAGEAWAWSLPDGRRPSVQALVAADDGLLFAAVDHGVLRFEPATRQVRWLAGGPMPGLTDGEGHDAAFREPESLLLHEDGLLVADAGNHALRTVLRSGRTALLLGGRPGFIDGPAGRARLRQPHGLWRHPRWGVLVCDTGNHALRRLDGQGLTTLAGDGMPGRVPGPLPDVRLIAPVGLAGDWLLGSGGRLWRWVPA